MTKKKCSWNLGCSDSSGFYGLGFLGALIYYLSVATGFWSIVIGILKAVIWPVFLVFELMKFLAM